VSSQLGTILFGVTVCIIDLIKIQRYGSSRPLSGALQCEGVPWTGDFILARPMWHSNRLFGLIVPEGRKGRKGKSGPLFFSVFCSGSRPVANISRIW
jgi:hypothetical protein